MKKLFCVVTIAVSCFLGCAPSDNGGADDSDTTTQIQTQPVQYVVAKC